MKQFIKFLMITVIISFLMDTISVSVMLAQTDYSKPTFENVSYGPQERNLLDFWKADSDGPAPLVVYIHGGGFKGGDKAGARTGSNYNYLKTCMESGINFASIIYRFRQTTRLDTIMLDCARAIQFLRHKADEYNIDKEKIAAYGGSAGGGASIWLGFHDDLADPESPDPILKESSRLAVIGHLNSQATYDFKKWPEILNVPDSWMDDYKAREDLELYHIPDRSYYDSAEIIQLRAFLDMPAFLDENDPPCYFHNMNPNTQPTSSGAIIHHPRHHIYLKELYDGLGLESALVLRDTPQEEFIDMMDFFKKFLLDPASVENQSNNSKPFTIFPNPANDHIKLSLNDKLLAGNKSIRLKIISLLGKELLVDSFLNQSSLSLDVSQLQSGIYILSISIGGKFYNEKVMIK